MPTLKIHKGLTNTDSVALKRLLEAAELQPIDRFKKAFVLMSLANTFKKGVIKNPQGLGIVLKRSIT